MEPWVLKVGVFLITVVVAIIGYFLKTRAEKIDKAVLDLSELKSHFSVLEQRMDTLENTNLPLLEDIRKEMSYVKNSMAVVQSELSNLKIFTDKQDSKIDNYLHYHKRRDDQD